MRYTFRSCLCRIVSGVVLLGVSDGNALAVPFDANSFAGAGIESFEGLGLGGNIVTQQGVYMWVKGPITFSSGVSLTGPFPQPASDRGLVLCDFSFHPGAAFSLGDYGTIASAADVPDGSAFLGFSDQDETRPFEFTFTSNMRSVGAFVTGPPGINATMTAYDSMGSVVASAGIQARPVPFWDDNFISVEANGIRKVTIGGRVIVVDALMFNAVPEPSTFALWLPAILTLFHRQRTRLRDEA